MTTRRPRALRTALTAAVLPLLVAGLAACSSGGDDETTSDDSVQKQARAWDTTLATCMRDAGFEFGDPSTDGVSIDGTAGQEWFDQFDSCLESTTDELGERPVTEAEKKAGEEAGEEFAKAQECLEEHGIEFPEGDDGLVQAPEVPDDVAATCGWDGFVQPAAGE